MSLSRTHRSRIKNCPSACHNEFLITPVANTVVHLLSSIMQDVSYPSRGNSAGGSTTSASIQQPRQQLSLPSSPAAPPSIDPLLPAPPTAVTPSITTSPVRPAPVLSSVPYRTGSVSGAKPVHTYEKLHGFGGTALTALQAGIWPDGYCVGWPKEERV